jgi:hypothetical protein
MKNIQAQTRPASRSSAAPRATSVPAAPRVLPGLGRWSTARSRPRLLTIDWMGVRSGGFR